MKDDLQVVLDDLFRNNHYTDEKNADELIAHINQIAKDGLPQMLYRYRKCSKYSIRDFRNDSVTAVKPSLFNDPYDCLLKYDVPQKIDEMSKEQFEQIVEYYKATDHLPEEMEKYLSMEMQNDYKRLLEQYIDGGWSYDENVKSNFNPISFLIENALNPCTNVLHHFSRVVCFSKRNDSILMWSHYAGEHTGFVLGYDIRADFNKDAMNNIFPVIYSKNRYDASEAVRYIVGEMFKMQNNINQDQLFYLAAALYKSKDWSYEKEWRLISYGHEEDFVKFQLRPSCIFYGSRIEHDDFEELHDIAIAKGIKEYSATIDSSSPHYKMKLKRLKS